MHALALIQRKRAGGEAEPLGSRTTERGTNLWLNELSLYVLYWSESLPERAVNCLHESLPEERASHESPKADSRTRTVEPGGSNHLPLHCDTTSTLSLFLFTLTLVPPSLWAKHQQALSVSGKPGVDSIVRSSFNLHILSSTFLDD